MVIIEIAKGFAGLDTRRGFGLQRGVFVHMKMRRSVVMRMSAEQVAMSAPGSTELSINIKKPKEQQRPSGDPGKPGPNLLVERNSKPGNEHAKEGDILPAALEAKMLVPGLTVTPEVDDRHTASDVGGRLDLTKEWRLNIPDPVEATKNYRRALGEAAPAAEHTQTAIAVSSLDAKIAAVRAEDQKAIP